MIFALQNWSNECYNNKPFELPMSWVEADMMDGANGKVPDKGPLSLSYKTWPGCKRTRVRRRMCDKLLLGEVLAKRSVDDPLGSGILMIDLLPGASTGETWVQLEGVRSGSILVEVSVEPDPTRGALAKEGLVTVRIIRAKNLIAADACGTSDPYCVLSLGSDSLANFAKVSGSGASACLFLILRGCHALFTRRVWCCRLWSLNSTKLSSFRKWTCLCSCHSRLRWFSLDSCVGALICVTNADRCLIGTIRMRKMTKPMCKSCKCKAQPLLPNLSWRLQRRCRPSGPGEIVKMKF